MKPSILFFLFFFSISNSIISQASSQQLCKDILLNLSIDSAITELAKLHLKLESAKIQGVSSLALIALGYDYKTEEKKILDYIAITNIITKTELHRKMKSAIALLQIKNDRADKNENKKEQTDSIKVALNPITLSKKIIFNKIKPGKFKMGAAKTETEIVASFEMMSTLVTQMMWARLNIVMGETNLGKINPSEFVFGEDSQVVQIEKLEIQIKPDHPVEAVSWHEVIEFIDKLNQLSNSDNVSIQSSITKIIPDHNKGDIYDLPTAAQREFVMRKQLSESDILDYAWYSENSNGQTHPIATLKPHMIDGQAFYDLEGNVWEWTKDLQHTSITLHGHKNPITATGSLRSVYGGSILFSAKDFNTKLDFSPGKSSAVGFRLVRTRP